MDSILAGAARESERNIIWYETGAGKFLHPDYWEDRETFPLDLPVPAREEAVQWLEERDIPWAQRIRFKADTVILDSDYNQKGNIMAVINAVDPLRDSDVFQVTESIVEGRFPEEGEDTAAIGLWMSEDLGIEIGDILLLNTETRHGSKEIIEVEVVGFLHCANPLITRNGIFIPLDAASEYLEMDDDVTEIAYRLPEFAEKKESRDPVLLSAEEEIPGVEVMSWRELAYDFIAITKMKSTGTSIILFFVFIIAGVGLSNTLLMAILERTKEIGMMRALGMDEREIRRLLLLEAVFIGIIGGLLGVILGILINIPTVRYGWDYSEIMRTTDMGYRSLGVFYGSWRPGIYVLTVAAGVFMSFVIALVPTKKILKWSIIENLGRD
jgi:ABC-type lipoprotein release transport system permease subunit